MTFVDFPLSPSLVTKLKLATFTHCVVQSEVHDSPFTKLLHKKIRCGKRIHPHLSFLAIEVMLYMDE